MTQPEETTAAKKATVNINIMDAPQVERALSDAAAMVAWARAERDEQRARAEKAEARLAEERRSWAAESKAAKQLLGEMRNQPEGGRDLLQCINDHLGGLNRCRKERDEFRASHAAIDRLLAERTRERDEARAEALKVGLAGKEAAENCDAATAACRRAQRLAEEAGADCDRALRERDEAREQLAKLEWAGLERPATGGPLLAACVICHGFKNDRAAHRFFTSTDQIGHRPTCWFAKKEAEKSEERTIDDALIRAAASLAVSYAWRYACGADVGTQDATETARPEPRFKVGEKVVWEESQTSQREGHVESIGNGAYLVRSRSGHLFSWAEDRLKPAPKFAVGEWVEAKGVTGPVIARHWERSRANTWSYDVQTPRWVRLLYEFELTAQTPQHKHDCEGCVFLGRMGKWDLWFSAKGSIFVPGPSVFANGGSDPLGEYRECSAIEPTSPELTEARRRAVARGLVK
jgi:hypothetical protein